MRDRINLRIAALLVLFNAGLLQAQSEPWYWPLKDINFPVPLDKINAMTPRPTKLRFFVAVDKGNWRAVSEKALNELDLIDPDRNRRGFRYTSPIDGEYDFALQFVYADGTADPRDTEMRAQYRVVFDTKPPVVRVGVIGTTGITWQVEDDNLRADGVTLEYRRVGERNWLPINTRAMRTRDSYTFNNLDRVNPIEVRVIGRDRGGLETVSRIIGLPTTVAGTGLPEGTDAGYGNPRSGEGDGAPTIDYVNTSNLSVESRLARVTRSGVKQAQLWVNDGKTGWKLDKTQSVNITPNDKDPVLKMPYKAAKDGRYGFIVIPINGAGGKQDDPRPDDPAQFLIEVDTEKPFVKVKNIRVGPGGTVGPRVEVEWDALDKNLWREPIVIEYSEDRTADTWKAIHTGKLANTGRYSWEVEDKNLWKFYVRVSALDMASNRGEHVYEKEVLIDLDTPKAIIEKVQGSGGPQPYESEKPASPSSRAPVNPAPGPAPTTTPTSAPTPKPVSGPPVPTLPPKK